jgi:hypothetical protein
VLKHINLVNSNLKCLFSPSLEALDIVLNNTKKKKLTKIELNRNNSKLDTSPQADARGL